MAGTDSAGGRTAVVVWTSPDGADVAAGHRRPGSAPIPTAERGDQPRPWPATTSWSAPGSAPGWRWPESSDGQTWSALEAAGGDAERVRTRWCVAAPAGDRLVLAATGEDTSTRIWSSLGRPLTVAADSRRRTLGLARRAERAGCRTALVGARANALRVNSRRRTRWRWLGYTSGFMPVPTSPPR